MKLFIERVIHIVLITPLIIGGCITYLLAGILAPFSKTARNFFK